MAVSRSCSSKKNKARGTAAFFAKLSQGWRSHSHLSGAVYAESYLELASERDLCVDLKSKVLSKPPCDPIQSPPVRSILDNKDEFGFENFNQLINALSTRHYAAVCIWAGSVLLNFPKIFSGT